MTKAMMKPINPYDPAWIEYNLQNPHELKAVGADVSPGADGDNGNAGADDASARGGDADEGGASSRSRSGLFSAVDADGEGSSSDKAGEAGQGLRDQDKGNKEGAQRPEWLAEKFWDAEKGEARLESMSKAYATLEAAHDKLKSSKGNKAPKDADDYLKDGFEMPEGAENVKEFTADDPALQAFAKVAHKYGLPQEAFKGIVSEFLQSINGELPAPIDPEAEIEKLGNNGKQIVQAALVWADSLEASGRYSADEVDRLVADYAQDAAGIQLLMKLREDMGNKAMPIDADFDGKSYSEADYYARHRDPRYSKDAKFREETEEIGKMLFGENAGGASRQGLLK